MLLRKELITEAIVDNLFSWRHSGFSIHGAVRVDDRRVVFDSGHRGAEVWVIEDAQSLLKA